MSIAGRRTEGKESRSTNTKDWNLICFTVYHETGIVPFSLYEHLDDSTIDFGSALRVWFTLESYELILLTDGVSSNRDYRRATRGSLSNSRGCR